jgi:ribonuclease P protein component
MFPREQRLTKAREFAALIQHGRMLTQGPLILRALRHDSGKARFGFAVGKRVGNAVVRNRTKRRLREILRHLPVDQGWDILVSARPGAASADYHALRRVIISLLQRGGVLTRPVAGETGEDRE